MDQKYQWGTRVTMEYLAYTDPEDESTAYVAEVLVSEYEHNNKEDARARVQNFLYMEKLRAQGRGGRRPKYQRTSAVKLIRRPVGEWEEISTVDA